jgi:hypothetical protein
MIFLHPTAPNLTSISSSHNLNLIVIIICHPLISAASAPIRHSLLAAARDNSIFPLSLCITEAISSGLLLVEFRLVDDVGVVVVVVGEVVVAVLLVDSLLELLKLL